MLVVEQLSKRIGSHQILSAISFQAQAGSVVAFLGPNGAGKTTLLRTIMGLLVTPEPDLKQRTNLVMLDGNPINHLAIDQRVGRGLIYLPQHPSLIQALSVRDNLAMVFCYHQFWQGKTRKEFDQTVAYWLDATSLSHALDQKAGVLSGGQKRKLEVVRSLLMDPKVLMLDEPFAGVDPKSIYELKAIFSSLAANGMCVIISDHHVDQLCSIAQRVFVVLAGRIVASGSLQDILANKDTKEKYLGTEFFDEISARFLKSNQ